MAGCLSSSTTFDFAGPRRSGSHSRLLRHVGSGRFAASLGALKELHAPRTSDLQCDLMCKAFVALSGGEGLREGFDMGSFKLT